jgi:hypothetical protein
MRCAAEALEKYSRKSYVAAVDIAGWYIEAGQEAKALEWLEKGVETRDSNGPYLDLPVHDSLRSDPRFQDLMRRMSLSPQGDTP